MQNFSIAWNRASLGTGVLSTLVLSPLSAQPSPGFYSGDGRSPAVVAAPLTRCAAHLAITDASVMIEELPEPTYVHSLSRSEISALEKQSGGYRRDAVGLTLVMAGMVQTRIREAQPQNGTGCAVVESVRILPMKEVTVYVAREYEPGSCNFEVIKRHEDQHVAIARRLVTEYRPRLLAAVTGARIQDVPSAVQEVIDDLQRAMRYANRVLDRRDTDRAFRECAFW